MREPEQRIALVIRGVVRQAMVDAGVEALSLAHAPTAASALIERWCGTAFQQNGKALMVSAASKTDLLLAGPAAGADLYPLGDLYASELAAWGVTELDARLRDMARQAGGIEPLDGVLRKLLDERRPPDAAFAGLPHIRDAVMKRLQDTRFRRAHMGIVPKIGPRTIGIDLHI
ncbi:MAG TPA: hypothetical protein VGC44_03440 [Longimicrobiales bacterium]